MCPRYEWCQVRGAGCTIDQISTCGVYQFFENSITAFKETIRQKLIERGAFTYEEEWYQKLTSFLKEIKLFSTSEIRKAIKEAEDEVVGEFYPNKTKEKYQR